MDATFNELLSGPIAFLTFPLFWAFTCWMIALTSGWQRAARRYRSELEPYGWRWVTYANVGWARYKNVLRVGQSEEGLHLKVMFLFRPGHPRLMVPWHEVQDEGVRSFLWSTTRRLRLGPGGPLLKLPVRVADELPLERIHDDNVLRAFE
jgi:hypothetical protein